MRHNRTAHGSSRTAHPEPVARISDAPVPLSDDMARRTRRYLIQMSIRLVCFVAAVMVDHWTRWLLLVGAVVLPYFAVVLANASRGSRTVDAAYLDPRRIEGTARPAGAGDGTAPGPDGRPAAGGEQTAGPDPEGRR